MLTKQDVIIICVALISLAFGVIIGGGVQRAIGNANSRPARWPSGVSGISGSGDGDYRNEQLRSAEAIRELKERSESIEARSERLEEYIRDAGRISESIDKAARNGQNSAREAVEILRAIQREVTQLEVWRNSAILYLNSGDSVDSIHGGALND